MHALAFSLFCVMTKQWTMYVTEHDKAMICTIVLYHWPFNISTYVLICVTYDVHSYILHYIK